MKKWRIPYLSALPVLVIAFLLCKLIFTTSISFSGILSALYSCIAYFVYGFVIAYFLNPILRTIERYIVKSSDSVRAKKVKRGISVALVYIIVLGFVAIFVMNIIPAIISGINDFIVAFPDYLASFQNWATDILGKINPGFAHDFESNVSNILTNIYGFIDGKMDVSKVGTAVTGVVSGSAKTIVRLIFGLVISVYFLFGKEELTKQSKRFVYALFSEDDADALVSYARAVNKIFFDFIISKILQAFVIFILGLVILIPFDIPLAPLISLFLAITNMIPYIGPWIGAIPSVLLALLYAPIKALIVIIFIIGMQIIDNLFIGPKIMSDRVGISPLLVIAGVAIGGTFGGVLGMFIGVPLVAVVKLVFYDRFVQTRLVRKNIDVDNR